MVRADEEILYSWRQFLLIAELRNFTLGTSIDVRMSSQVVAQMMHVAAPLVGEH